MDPWAWFLGIVVTFSTWMTPMTGHHEGWLIVYGSQKSLLANARYRDIPLGDHECGVAAMSPSMLGQFVYIRPGPNTEWVRCRVVDTVSRVDWYHSVVEINDIAEIPRWLAQQWGTEYGLEGEIYAGDCPPNEDSEPTRWLPEWKVDPIRPVIKYSAWPYPEPEDEPVCKMSKAKDER